MKPTNPSGENSGPWVRSRHRVVTKALTRLIGPVVRQKYGVTAEPFQGEANQPYLILYNHQTPCDQFFVTLSFRRPVYYLATEDIFSKGWLSSVLRYLVGPIPIIKQTTDLNAIQAMVQVAREGGSIAIAPEGNRTYSGKTEYMSPSIALLAKKLKLPIALYRIEGGYGVQPRWSDGIRKGSMRAYVSQVIQPSEYMGMTGEGLFSLIREGLRVNEAAPNGVFRSDKKAEFLERLIYICPDCGLSRFESDGNEIRCLKCGRRVRYGEDKRLEGVGFSFPFSFVNDWYEYQNRFINQLDVTKLVQDPLYQDAVSVYEVIVYRRKNLLGKDVALRLYGDRITLNERENREWTTLVFSDITGMALIGRNRLNVYYENGIYQFRGNRRFNAIKYMHLYYRHRNVTKGNGHGEFLGL